MASFASSGFSINAFSVNAFFFDAQVTQETARDTSGGSGKYKDEDIWAFIDSLKKAHRKDEVVKPEPRLEIRYQTDLYTPEVEKLILEIQTARAVSRPKTHILGLVKELDSALQVIQDEEDEVIELFLLN